MNNNTTYKDSPLGKIPSDWEVKTLNKVGVVITGNTPSRSNPEYWNGQYCWASAQDFKSKYISNTTEKLTDKGIGVARILPIGSLLITCIASIGKNAIAKVPMASNQQINAIITNQKHYNEWLYYFLENNKQRLQTLAGKTAVPIVSKSTFEKFKIIVPLLPEQTRIAEVLSTWDKAISNVQTTIEQVELRNKWLMQELLTGKRRLKGFSGEWKEYHLGDMFAERNETKNEELPLLSVGQNGIYPQADSIKRDISNDDKSKYKKICHGDIGYNTMRMWQGRSALSSLEGIVSPAYTILKPKKVSDSLFFSYLFKTPKLMNLFWRNSQGLVDDTLNCKYKDFSIIKLHLPDKEEQIAIAQVLQAANKEVQVLRSKLDKLKEQKKGLMQVLLTGKKRLVV
jgi:type I restriction enzyme S subunit